MSKKPEFGMIGLGEIAYKSTGGVMQKTLKAGGDTGGLQVRRNS